MARRATCILEKAIITEDGRAVIIRTPFESLPDWAKDAVRPRWRHPATCECAECWQERECTR